MNMVYKFYIIFTRLVLLLVTFSNTFADVPKNKAISNTFKKIQSMMIDDIYTFESKDIRTNIANNGLFADYHGDGSGGLFYKDVYSVFQGSIWVTGEVNGEKRGIIGDYEQDMGQGPWGQDNTDQAYKVYYVDISMLNDPENHDDFQNWPVNQGAPWVDVAGDGIYEPLPVGEDYPEFIGDKLAFFVANDGDPSLKSNMGTNPMDLEMQFLVYSFEQSFSDDLAASLFYKVLIINKGSNTIDNTYFGLWFDDDIGTPGNDLVGVSVDRGLSYTYNGDVDDLVIQGGMQDFIKGSDFLQGPMIDCITGGSVTFNLDASDADNDSLTYIIVNSTSNGTVSCGESDGICTYQPNTNFVGSDSFTYKVNDGLSDSSDATVTINVQASRGEIGAKNIQITSNKKRGFNLPHPNSHELEMAMKQIDYTTLADPDGFVRCASDELEKELQLINPEFIKKRNEFFEVVLENENRFKSEERISINIPVIFHVLYSNSNDNISKEQIGENFDQLNDDFKLENSDKDDIPSSPNPSNAPNDPGIDYSHHDVRGIHNISFIGSVGETEGSNLIEGQTIRRYQISQSTVSGVSEASNLASSTPTDSGAAGGYQNGYLNIYIAPLTGGLLGQAYLGFPEAVVLGSTVGSIDSPGTAGGYNRGRTLTHEIGHNFTYNHVFNSSSCSDQLWSDIPAQTQNNRTANTYEWPAGTGNFYGQGGVNSCIGTTGKGDQFMNYMDYVYDDQMRMFSEEQALDGYAWVASRNWFGNGNTAPVANNISLDATVNEDCSEGAKMFGTTFPGKKNLKMTSFSFFINGDATYTDPADIDEAYFYMQGLRKDGSPYPNEIAGNLYNQKYVFYGDPASDHTTDNPVDGNYAAAADRRSLMNVGPFTMSPGDSQEIVFNVMNIKGSDIFNSISNLFEANDSTQVWYDNDFQVLDDYYEVKNIEVSANTNQGNTPLPVNFSLNNSSGFLKLEWDFNNDGIIDSNSHNPTYTFTEAGTYTVTVNAFYNFFENGRFSREKSTDTTTILVQDNSTISITSDSLTTNEDTSVSKELEITNPSSRDFKLQIDLAPSNGIVSFNDLHLNYSPNKNFNGLDSLSVFAKAGSYESDSAVIKINVLPVDDTPVTGDVSVSTNEDTAVTVYLTASEFDGDDFEFEIIENPVYGSLSSILTSAGTDSVVYTPDADWYGTDQFKFEASDSSSRMNLGTAVIQVLPVNDAPITDDISVDTFEDVVTPIQLDFNDIDSNQLTITFSNPSNGSASLNSSYLEYTPNENYFGSDSLTYVVNDGEFDSNSSKVVINIEAVNDPSSDFTSNKQLTVNALSGKIYDLTTNYLMVNPNNIEDSLTFSWNASEDIDGDNIKYKLIGYDQISFLTIDDWTEELSFSWKIGDIIALTDTVNTFSGFWGVIASDGEFIVESDMGLTNTLSINGSDLIPENINLSQNYPNPFKGSTIIPFDLPESRYVVINIIDVKGRKIRTLIDGNQSSGFNSVLWDGKNEDGDEVSSGVYFYQINVKSNSSNKSYIKTKKLIKLR